MIGYGSGTAGFRFSVEAGGTYVLTLAYNKSLCFHQRYLRIRVNNGKEHELLFPTTKGASPTGRIQLTVELQSGENHLLLYNPVVTRADSSYLQYARMVENCKRPPRNGLSSPARRSAPSSIPSANGALLIPTNGEPRQAICGAPRRISCPSG